MAEAYYSNGTNFIKIDAKLFNAVSKDGDTMAGGLTSPCMLGEGDLNTYYHRIDMGHAGFNHFDFHEYGGIYNFYKNTAGTKNGASLICSIQPDGFHGTLTGDVNGKATECSNEYNIIVSSTQPTDSRCKLWIQP